MTMGRGTVTLEVLLRRDRVVVGVALLMVVTLSWAYLVHMGLHEPDAGVNAGAMALAPAQPWSAGYFAVMLVMWVVMMVGMMIPGAAPTILLFSALQRKIGSGPRESFSGSGFFTAGYLAAWTSFSVVATFAQWALGEAALLSSTMTSASPILGGILFIAAGLYQLTPLKNACLAHCRAPAQFLVRRWRAGRFGGFIMGLEHGTFCIGCCWVLMALLFTFGVMNLLWIAAITGFILVEKLAPAGAQFGRAGAALMLAVGAYLLIF